MLYVAAVSRNSGDERRGGCLGAVKQSQEGSHQSLKWDNKRRVGEMTLRKNQTAEIRLIACAYFKRLHVRGVEREQTLGADAQVRLPVKAVD